ncbi:MAG: TPM domain-containing protein [Rhodoferax sp.]|uniref:TPM domain-containing protein n=1 Tax=Rhodoferax sp. TaxID=50421 RepID=UPI0032668ACA
MQTQRILKHLLTTRAKVNTAFPRSALTAIESAIKASESAHYGEIRFVVEGALDGMPLFKGQSSKDRAIDLFSHLRIWDTEFNSGVLIYLLLADRQVEIIADRGIHAKAGTVAWTAICREMETAFRSGNFQEGVVRGVQALTQQLTEHFPVQTGNHNDLPDEPLVL